MKNAKSHGIAGRRRGASSARNPSHLRNGSGREKILNKKKGIAYLKGEARALSRDQTRERLELNLESLESYCKPGVILQEGWATGSDDLGYWPSRELLDEIERDVLFLALLERKRPLFRVWKAFEQVDKRMKTLQLELRVGHLIRRARGMFLGFSVLEKTVIEAVRGDTQAQCSLRAMTQEPQKLAELLRDYRRRTIQRCMAEPLTDWLIAVGHPQNVFESIAPAEEIAAGIKAEQKRASGRERIRRHRLGKKNSSK